MRNLYQRVDELLDRINFEAIHPGFSKCQFALYNDETVYLKNGEIPRDERFLGNTAIEYENDYMAIWKIDEAAAIDLDILAADMVHEMFHVYQRRQGEMQYPDDRLMLMYPHNMQNFQLKYAENQLLIEAFRAEAGRKAALFQAFLSMREVRQPMIGDFFAQELMVEELEGSAEFACCCALRQIAPQKAADRINWLIGQLQQVTPAFFDIRRMSYFTGTLCNLIKQELNESSTEQGLQKVHRELQEQRRQIIDDFLNAGTELVEEGGIFCGYDPMNMFRVEDMIYCSHFSCIMVNETPRVIHKPALLYMEKASKDQVKEYRVAR